MVLIFCVPLHSLSPKNGQGHKKNFLNSEKKQVYLDFRVVKEVKAERH